MKYLKMLVGVLMLLQADGLWALEVRDAWASQRYPWSGQVDVRFSLSGLEDGRIASVQLLARDEKTGASYAMRTLSGRRLTGVSNGQSSFVWDVDKDMGEFQCESLAVDVFLKIFDVAPVPEDAQYLVVDVSSGSQSASYPVEYLPSMPIGGWSDVYKTSKIVFRRIKAGTFVMGCDPDEFGAMRYLPDSPYSYDAIRHGVVLSKDYFIGVFEVTQRQWENVMGTRPSWFSGEGYAMRPVENVSYADIRGNAAWTDEASAHLVSSSSFLGVLRRRTGLAIFNLPTEAQWENACRAGVTSALNNGKDLTSVTYDDQASLLARYRGNSAYKGRIFRDWPSDKGTAVVGSYTPNAWGLYDFHGNVQEWCLDGFHELTVTASVTDPLGAYAADFPLRGGSWRDFAHQLRSACRHEFRPMDWKSVTTGFRIVGNPDDIYLESPRATAQFTIPSCSVDARPGIRTATETEHFISSTDWQTACPPADAVATIRHRTPDGNLSELHSFSGDRRVQVDWNPLTETVSGVHTFFHTISDKDTGAPIDVAEAHFKVMLPGEMGDYRAADPETRKKALVLPSSVSDWDELISLIIQSRDRMQTFGNPDFMPPGENPIVMTLGAFPVSEGLLDASAVAAETEHGVQVFRVRVRESADGFAAFVATVGSDVVHTGYVPYYDERKWTDAIYGAPPYWLSPGPLLDEWYRLRRPSRIEWFVTLVPADSFAAYEAARKASASTADEGLVGVEGMGADGFCTLKVNVKADAAVDVFGKDDAASAQWQYRGRAFLGRGVSTVGGLSLSSDSQWKVIVGSVDTDADGLRDPIETLVFGSNPDCADTSGGGVPDGEKVATLGLNPLLDDADGDGWLDGEEISLKKNPLAADSGANMSIRYSYDDDDRLLRTRIGIGDIGIDNALSPVGNAVRIQERSAK